MSGVYAMNPPRVPTSSLSMETSKDTWWCSQRRTEIDCVNLPTFELDDKIKTSEKIRSRNFKKLEKTTSMSVASDERCVREEQQ